MVSRAGRYYGSLFKCSRGVTQVDLLSPTILNMVLDTVICHWLTVLAGEDVEPEGFGTAVQNLTAFF